MKAMREFTTGNGKRVKANNPESAANKLFGNMKGHHWELRLPGDPMQMMPAGAWAYTVSDGDQTYVVELVEHG